MRTVGVIGCLVLIAACSAPEPQAENRAGAGMPVEQNSATGSVPNESGMAQAEHEAKGPPCLTQDGDAVTHKLKALGTEPFWAAEVDGRCVTYKTPEDQAGTRVWTHVDSGPDGPAWNGALRGRQFQLYVRPAPPPGCSDGMSDKVYSLEATLRVDGETRNGCAERL